MFKTINRNGKSYDNIARELYGTPGKAGDLAKINNNTDGEIVVYTQGEEAEKQSGIYLNTEGVNYTDFSSYMLIDSLRQVKIAVFEFPYEPDVHKFKAGQNVSIYDSGDIFLTGVIKNPLPELSEKGQILRLEIKSKAGILIDTVVPHPLEFDVLSLRSIIGTIANYFGIPVEFADDERLDYISKNEIDTSFVADLEESCWDFITRIATARGLFVQDTGVGLYVGPIIEKSITRNFIEGAVVGVNAWIPRFNVDRLGRYYEAHTQYPQSASAIVQIPFGLPITKRILKTDATEGGIEDYARWFACREIGEAYKLLLEVDDDFEIKKGDFVVVKSQTCYLNEEVVMIVEEVEKYNPQNIVLCLTLPCAYTGIIPESLPLC